MDVDRAVAHNKVMSSPPPFYVARNRGLFLLIIFNICKDKSGCSPRFLIHDLLADRIMWDLVVYLIGWLLFLLGE